MVFYKWGDWGPGRSNDLPKVMWLRNNRAKIQSVIFLLHDLFGNPQQGDDDDILETQHNLLWKGIVLQNEAETELLISQR